MVRPPCIPRGPRLGVPLALGAAATLCLAGCGGAGHHSTATDATTSSSLSTTTTATTSADATSAAPRRRRHPWPRPRGAPIGATQHVDAGTSTLLVTVSKVLDPLLGTGSSLLPGHRASGVQVAIHVVSGATYDSTASGDWSIRSTAGLASPLFVKEGVCATPLADFESLIGVGEARDGCVAFSVPRHARIISVRFSPHSRAKGSVAWR